MKKLKENRLMSFIVVGLVYILATVVGVLVYNALSFQWWLNLLIADVVATIFTFVFSLVFDNASVYDPYWSVQPIVIVMAFAIGKTLTVTRVLLLVAICLWGIRLTANWAYTFLDLTHQDWRYTMLKERTKTFYPVINFVGIHLVPTLVVYLCVVPAVYAFLYDVEFSLVTLLFFIQSVGAFTMQGIADVQMHLYRKNRTTPFIRTGLWKYSRHPNYFGEILMWWGVALMVICTNLSNWHLVAGAVANTLLFMFVSIPLADGRQSQKDGFSQYKMETRALLPIKK